MTDEVRDQTSPEVARDRLLRLQTALESVLLGQQPLVRELLTAIVAGGHVLLEGLPGLGKTHLAKGLANALGVSLGRVQCTPDLMPSDITGSEVLQRAENGRVRMEFMPGPVFHSLVLVDEINRATPRTQAALLEAMQEGQVTAGGRAHALPRPFWVLATQNPIELEGTYPLPEAQLDRFMFSVYVDYPSPNEEKEIVKSTTSAYVPGLVRVLGANEIAELQGLVRRVPVADEVIDYAVRLAGATRPSGKARPEFIPDWVSWGAGPRASQYLILGAKTRAMLQGRYTPAVDDVRAVARPVLRHRIVTNFAAEAENVKPDTIVRRLVEEL